MLQRGGLMWPCRRLGMVHLDTVGPKALLAATTAEHRQLQALRQEQAVP
jgi:hypothetical protein